MNSAFVGYKECSRRPRWLTPSLICITLHILTEAVIIISLNNYADRGAGWPMWKTASTLRNA